MECSEELQVYGKSLLDFRDKTLSGPKTNHGIENNLGAYSED